MMNLEYLANQLSEMILTNLQEFYEKEDTEELTHELASQMTEQLKSLVLSIAKKTMKSFLEGYDTTESTIEHGGNLYRKKQKSAKDFISIFGKIRIMRNIYQMDRGGKSIAPLDQAWNMEREFLTPQVRENILYVCAHDSPTEVENILEKIAFFQVPASSIKKLVNTTGKFIEENKDELQERIHNKEEMIDKPDVMVASLDGVNVLLNEKGKKKGRPKERPDKQTSTVSKSAYKNAVCGTVSFYNIDKQGDTGDKKAQRFMTKYVSRMPEDCYPTFKHDFEKEILHCSRAKPVVKIMLTDAHTSIQGYVKGNPFYKDFIWMLDFYHAAEHLSKLAELIFGKSSEKGKKWYTEKRHKLKHSEDGPDKVIRSAEYYIKTHVKVKSKRTAAIRELNYFKKHKKLMNYKMHLDNGWPIGSGVIEAACKTLVKQRMCRSGQRWSRKGGQNILHLRTFVKSGRWDNYWEEYIAIKYPRKCA